MLIKYIALYRKDYSSYWQNILAEAFSIGSVSYDNYWFGGYISEVIIFDRNLKQSEITEINKYLAKKYDITVN